MKNRIFNRLKKNLIISFIIVSFIVNGVISATFNNVRTVYGESKRYTVSDVQDIYDDIVEFKLNKSGSTSIQDWIDTELSKNAGITSEWYILALSQNGKYDFKNYELGLKNYLENNDVYSASSRQKYALSFATIGSSDEYISEVLDDSIGKQGIMSYIYGLHLLNNGYESDLITSDTVKDEILKLQLNDGGFAITGTISDNDVTSMAIQCLAPYYKTNANVKNAIDKAISLLSARQLDDGDYSSYGVPNSESTAQVITALCSLGINPESDERFIKNGKSLIAGLKKYQLDDGSFSHKENGEFDENATSQVFYSLVAFLRMSENKSGLYILDSCNDISSNNGSSYLGSSNEDETTQTDSADKLIDNKINDKEIANYKIWVSLGVIIISGITGVILFIKKKSNKKNLIVLVVVTILAICFIMFTDFQSKDSYYNGKDTRKEDVIGSVTFSIRCDKAIGKTESEYIPSDGVILDNTEFKIDEDDTVYDILIEASRKYNIHLDYSGDENNAYIKGINYLYEFECGELSGWTYKVNEETASVGCDKYALKDGDKIEWIYTLELGRDIE
ncbi:MAG: DUF4430 domain-containing protein [Lachnospiraceae bacterium]|nr:DUF4430 domain-containing protein [Lachnospiraceae bacterium]